MARSRASSKKAGTAFETQCAKYLSEKLGIPAKRAPKNGAKDEGDIYGVLHHGNKVVIECKSPGRNSSLSLPAWWSETLCEIDNLEGAKTGVLVIKQFGKNVDQAYCVVDNTHWDILCGETKLGEPIQMRTSRFKEWQESLSTGNHVVTKRIGSEGSWYIFTLEDATKLFDSVDDVKTLYLSSDDIALLQENGSLVMTDIAGENIVIKMS